MTPGRMLAARAMLLAGVSSAVMGSASCAPRREGVTPYVTCDAPDCGDDVKVEVK